MTQMLIDFFKILLLVKPSMFTWYFPLKKEVVAAAVVGGNTVSTYRLQCCLRKPFALASLALSDTFLSHRSIIQ